MAMSYPRPHRISRSPGAKRFLLAVSVSAAALSAGAQPVTTVPFRLQDNRILVDILLDQKGPFRVIFDTGGSNVMTPAVRHTLGAALSVQGHVSGAGEDSVESGQSWVREITLGQFTLHDQDFLVLDLEPIRKAFDFERLDGVIGYEVLERAGVRIDFDRSVRELYEPGTLGFHQPSAFVPVAHGPG